MADVQRGGAASEGRTARQVGRGGHCLPALAQTWMSLITIVIMMIIIIMIITIIIIIKTSLYNLRSRGDGPVLRDASADHGRAPAYHRRASRLTCPVRPGRSGGPQVQVPRGCGRRPRGSRQLRRRSRQPGCGDGAVSLSAATRGGGAAVGTSRKPAPSRRGGAQHSPGEPPELPAGVHYF